MTIRVYSGDSLIEEVVVTTEDQLEKIASYWSDEGYKVRISEVQK